MKKKTLSVIIPLFNEAEGIPFLVKALNQYFAQDLPFEGTVIFVDDGSIDNSYEVLAEQQHLQYQAQYLKLSRNYGSHQACRAGLQQVNSDYTTVISADLQDPLQLLEQLFNLCESGVDIGLAARKTQNISIKARFFSKLYSQLIKKFVIPTYPDGGFDVFMISAKVLTILNQNVEKNSSLFLQVLTLGFNQEVIYFEKAKRQVGRSKWTLTKKIKLLIDSFVAFSYLPIRLVSVFGISMAFSGFGLMFYIIGRKLLLNDLEAGWPALVSILMLGFGITNIALGVIAEYLWRTYANTRNNPPFIIESNQILEGTSE